ncbi:MAG: hypothetical protein ACK4TP_10160 [Hyphomicrobium sp.]
MSIETLKEQYGLTTAAEIPAKPKPADDHAQTRVRWSREKKHAFRAMAPAALCIVATDGPVSVVTYDASGQVLARFGHNRGCWPMRVATTSSWADTITGAYDKSPFVRTGVQIRVWCGDERKRDRLAEAVTGLLGDMSEEAMGAALINGFVDAGPDVDMTLFEAEIHAIADRLKIVVWDDERLSARLDEMEARVARMRVGGR